MGQLRDPHLPDHIDHRPPLLGLLQRIGDLPLRKLLLHGISLPLPNLLLCQKTTLSAGLVSGGLVSGSIFAPY
jgi:hypothetical protein